MKILLVEDEEAFLFPVKKFLTQQLYACDTAMDYREAEEKMLVNEYDCIILDIRLPGGSGLDLLRKLKKVNPGAAVIIASSNRETQDKIEGLELGADDYISKPYDFEELNARIRSLLRRKNFDGNPEIKFNEITVNPDSHAVQVNSKEISLTPKEYDLLVFFISSKGRVVTKEYLVDKVWGDEAEDANSYDFIYSHIKNLRKKLTDAGSKDYIHAVYGTGYRFYDE